MNKTKDSKNLRHRLCHHGEVPEVLLSDILANKCSDNGQMGKYDHCKILEKF